MYFQRGIPGSIEAYPEIMRYPGRQWQQASQVLPGAGERGANDGGAQKYRPCGEGPGPAQPEERRADLAKVLIHDYGIRAYAGFRLQGSIQSRHLVGQPDVILVGEVYEVAARVAQCALKVSHVADPDRICDHSNTPVGAL